MYHGYTKSKSHKKITGFYFFTKFALKYFIFNENLPQRLYFGHFRDESFRENLRIYTIFKYKYFRIHILLKNYFFNMFYIFKLKFKFY